MIIESQHGDFYISVQHRTGKTPVVRLSRKFKQREAYFILEAGEALSISNALVDCSEEIEFWSTLRGKQ